MCIRDRSKPEHESGPGRRPSKLSPSEILKEEDRTGKHVEIMLFTVAVKMMLRIYTKTQKTVTS